MGTDLYFTTDRGDLWRVPTAGGEAVRLADRAGTAWELDVESSCATFTVERSDGSGDVVTVAR